MSPLFLIVLILPLNVLQSQEKKILEIEDELSEIPDEDIESSNQRIIISGEDEQILRPRKRDLRFIFPTKIDDLRWREYHYSIAKKGKSLDKKVERKGNFSLSYAAFHTLNFALDLVKRDEYGNYRIKYDRIQRDFVEIDNAAVSNSARALDNLSITTEFRPSAVYRFVFNLGYKNERLDLQSNSVYNNHDSKTVSIQLGNRFTLNKKNRLDINVGGLMNNLDQTDVAGAVLTDQYYDVRPEIAWNYISDKRTSLELKLKAVIENHDLATPTSSNTQMNSFEFQAGVLLPLVAKRVTKNKFEWKLDLFVGVLGYYDETFGFLPGPNVRLDSRLGQWYSSLGFKRNASRTNATDNAVNMPYHRVSDLTEPSDNWDVAWDNVFPATQNLEIKIRAGYISHTTFFESYAVDSVYFQQKTSFTDMYGAGFARWNIVKTLLFELGVEAHQFSENIAITRPLNLLLNLQFEPGKWTALIESTIGNYIDPVTKAEETFTWLSFSVKRKMDPTISLEFRINNILDDPYVFLPPYKNSGRSYLAVFHMSM